MSSESVVLTTTEAFLPEQAGFKAMFAELGQEMLDCKAIIDKKVPASEDDIGFAYRRLFQIFRIIDETREAMEGRSVNRGPGDPLNWHPPRRVEGGG
jgi:hypothetical protein